MNIPMHRFKYTKLRAQKGYNVFVDLDTNLVIVFEALQRPERKDPGKQRDHGR
jgi:hypothetical protein